MQRTIEWTDSTFNPWVGCTKIARARGALSACDFCYAEKWAKRSGQVEWGNHPRRRTTASYWRSPLVWNSRARLFQHEHGRRQRVFCASLADVFDNQVDPAWRADLFNLIRECDQLDWQLLTKRPQNIRKMLPADWGDGYPNVFDSGRCARLQTARLVSSQDSRRSSLRELRTGYRTTWAARHRWPLSGWVIIGGESGVRSDLIRLTDPQCARCNRGGPSCRSRTILETVGNVQEQSIRRRTGAY
jgi:protein gp37